MSIKFQASSFMFVAALLVLGLLAQAVAADEIWLKSGLKVEGRILGTDGKAVTLEPALNAGQARIPYPLALIEKIKFENDNTVARLLVSADVKDLPELEKRWVLRRLFLSLPESNAGTLGLACARLQLAKETKKAAREALELCSVIEKGDWLASRRTEAAGLRLSALARLGRAEQAVEEASRMEGISGEDEASLALLRARARLAQAESACSKLQDLEKKWPKWQLMTDKRVEHEQLLNAALDGFMFPVVFHADLKKLCAEGLWRAAELSCRAGDKDGATTCVSEILNYYPEPEFKGRAERLAREYKLSVENKVRR
ncbi:MAG: hypothetical protein PHD76_04660 [Methylacidiphilales bacterium]|nr:hypothetical protein [Candidatus Methylacidiphilales bacterium]